MVKSRWYCPISATHGETGPAWLRQHKSTKAVKAYTDVEAPLPPDGVGQGHAGNVSFCTERIRTRSKVSAARLLSGIRATARPPGRQWGHRERDRDRSAEG